MITRVRSSLPSRIRIGLAIGERTVRAVGVRGDAVLWAIEGERDDDDALADVIEQLLERVPLLRWPRPELAAALGPSCSQVRQLHDLPPVRSRRELAALVQEGAGRFFLRNGVPLVTSHVLGARADEPSWAAALDQPVVQAISVACRNKGLRFTAAVPSVVVLGRVLPLDRLTWSDGGTVAECQYAGGMLTECKRYWRASIEDTVVSEEESPSSNAASAVLDERVAGALSAVGPNAVRFSDAYGAATIAARAPLTYQPDETQATARPVPRWRLALATVMLLATLTTAIAAPALREAHTSSRAMVRLTALGAERLEAARLQRELELVSVALEAVADFAAGRHSSLGVLEELADSLPEGAALVMLRIDSLAGTAVVLSPAMTTVIETLDRLPAITGIEIVGPVTRETVAGHDLERATLRFALTAPASAESMQSARGQDGGS